MPHPIPAFADNPAGRYLLDRLATARLSTRLTRDSSGDLNFIRYMGQGVRADVRDSFSPATMLAQLRTMADVHGAALYAAGDLFAWRAHNELCGDRYDSPADATLARLRGEYEGGLPAYEVAA